MSSTASTSPRSAHWSTPSWTRAARSSGCEEEAMTKTLTLAMMDPPYETARTTTAFRLVDAALRKGHTVRVFAYEGAVNLTMAEQAPHPNPVKGTSADEEAHPTTKDWVAALLRLGGGRLSWVNCGLCVDERG